MLIEQGTATEFTKHEEELEKLEDTIIFYEVYIVKEEPIDVEKLGVTINWILLVSELIIDDSFKDYSWVPVKLEIKVVGTTVVIAETVVPYITGLAKLFY